jgi:hypothetical protein
MMHSTVRANADQRTKKCQGKYHHYDCDYGHGSACLPSWRRHALAQIFASKKEPKTAKKTTHRDTFV